MLLRSFVFLTLMVLITSCKIDLTNPNEPVPNTFTVNGPGYTNAAFSCFENDSARMALEFAGMGQLWLKGITDKTGETFLIGAYTKSNAVGTYIIGSEGTAMTLVITENGEEHIYPATSGTITIDGWQPVGGIVKGHFEARLALGGNLSFEIMQITCPSFELRSGTY